MTTDNRGSGRNGESMDDHKTVSAEEALSQLRNHQYSHVNDVYHEHPRALRTVIALHAKLDEVERESAEKTTAIITADRQRETAERERDALRARLKELERRPSEAAVRYDAERGLLMLLWDAIDGEQDGDAPGNRALRDNLIARVREKVEELERERDEARQERDEVADMLTKTGVWMHERAVFAEHLWAELAGYVQAHIEREQAFGALCKERDEARAERDRLARILAEHGHVECSGCGATLSPPFADGDLCGICCVGEAMEAAAAARKGDA